MDPAAPGETDRYCLVCCQERGEGGTCDSCGRSVDDQPARQPGNLPPGALLDRRYLVGRSLGCGTFGITYLAVDVWLRLRVAVKEYMPREMAMRSTEGEVVPNTDEDADTFRYGLQSFLSEGRKLARFEGHPNIVGVKSFFEENGTAYLVMQYLDGCSLEQYRRARGGKLPVGEVLAIAVAILEGLQTIHDVGMLHRDIKPQNVIITAAGKVKLIDFGAARFAAGQRTSNLSQVLTPRYAPLEQYQPDGIQGPWTDVYATGATLYKVLTGEPPPDAVGRALKGTPLLSPRELLGDEVSETVSSALVKALETDGAARYQSAEEFIDGLCDPEQTPLVWPSPPSADCWDAETSDSDPEAGVVSASDLRSVAPARSGSDLQSVAPAQGGSGSGSAASASSASEVPSVVPAAGSPNQGSASESSRPAGKGTGRSGVRRRRKRRKRRTGLMWLNSILGLVAVALVVVLVLLLIETGDRDSPVVGCGELSAVQCAAEAVRLDLDGRSSRALLLAYLAPVEEHHTRDRIFGKASVDAAWGSRERFVCEAAPAPCNTLDFWSADRRAPAGDRALSALAGRCDKGDRDACYLSILVQRRLTLVESEGPLEPDTETGFGTEGDHRGTTGGLEDGRERTADPVGGRRDPPIRTEASETRRAGPVTTDERAGSTLPERGGTSTDPSGGEALERTKEERVERVVGEPTEAEHVVGESPENVVSEPTERVVGERVERVVRERSERVVGEPVERVVEDPTPGSATDDQD